MFDKLKDAVGDILQGDTASAEQAVNDATGGAGLDGIVSQLGGMSGIMDAIKNVDFPIGVDDLVPMLEKAGLPSGIVDQVKNSGIGQIDSVDDLTALAKKFLG